MLLQSLSMLPAQALHITVPCISMQQHAQVDAAYILVNKAVPYKQEATV